VRLALRTQQVIAHESGVADSVDPLAGSYLIEMLTDEIERAASEYIARIDALGGALAAIERGFMQNEIQEAAYAAQKSIEAGEQIVVGVNQFQTDEKVTLERLEVDPAIEAAARQRLEVLRRERDGARAQELRGRLDSAARGAENLMPLFVECVEADVTLGEICNTLRGVWGEYVAQGF
jgi:methylmalonyl-CoA mutase, N-terminal domain